MRRIALVAVAFALIGVIASVQLTSADSNGTVTKKETKPAKIITAAEQKETPAQPVAPAPVLVTVKEGDNLSTIAEAHDTTYVRVFNANESIANPNVINPGQELRIPNADEQLPERALPAPVVVAAPVAAAAAAPVANYAPVAAAPRASYPAVSGNDAKAFIYAHESGNNPNATNASGCYGLGQDCNGRVRAQCGADYACQDAFFTNYAMSRYGSWEAALAFWNANHWW